MGKNETLIMLKPRRENTLRSEGMKGVLELLFFKDPDIARDALEFANHIKERQRTGDQYKVEEWQSYVKEAGITISRYYSIVNKLRGTGILRREHGNFVISEDFPRLLNEVVQIYYAWRAV
jgi:hypothetical protein